MSNAMLNIIQESVKIPEKMKNCVNIITRVDLRVNLVAFLDFPCKRTSQYEILANEIDLNRKYSKEC